MSNVKGVAEKYFATEVQMLSMIMIFVTVQWVK
jgi:hypothetical protein